MTARPAIEVRRWRVPAGAALPRSSPLGVAASAPLGDVLEVGDAIWISLPRDSFDRESPDALAALLPEPAPGMLVVVADVLERGSWLGRILGREARVARAVRGSALLLRGFAEIGATADRASGLDLCWGRA